MFWGLDATAWAALAAIGAFLAAVASMIAAIFTHWGSGARPRVRIWLGSRTESALARREVGSEGDGPFWDSDGIEGAVVRVENAGRTALTVAMPVFECLDPLWAPRRWRRLGRRRMHTVGTWAIPFEGLEISFPLRVEPHDFKEFFLDLEPLFGPPDHRTKGLPRDWRLVRVRVPVAGRRDVVVRRQPILASPDMPQLSGEPVTLRQFLYRHFLRGDLRRGQANPEEHRLPLAQMATWELLDLHRKRGFFTTGSIRVAVRPLLDEGDYRMVALEVAFALRDAGLMTLEQSRDMAEPVD